VKTSLNGERKEKERRSGGKNKKRKTRKNIREAVCRREKNRERRSFFPSSLRCWEIRKASSRREEGEEKAGKTRKERETIDKQGLPFRSLLSFFCI